jgi:hypothetical protein
VVELATHILGGNGSGFHMVANKAVLLFYYVFYDYPVAAKLEKSELPTNYWGNWTTIQ